MLDVEQVSGAIVRVYGETGKSVRLTTDYNKVRARVSKPSKTVDGDFFYVGAYAWICGKCGASIYAVDKPRFCVRCQGQNRQKERRW